MAKFNLTVPIDVSAIPDAKGSVKIAVIDAAGQTQSQVIDVSKAKSATFTFNEAPKGARVLVGPANADDADLPKLRTLGTNVAASALRGTAGTVAPIIISAIDFDFWLRWCREFTIRGRVACADGNAVPGATVCAYDVNWFWWWLSKRQVGCAMTDINGTFEIKFTWCCGWYPWWWWLLREWEIDFHLADRLINILPPELKIKPIPLPDPSPNLRVFESILPNAGGTPSKSIQVGRTAPAKTADLSALRPDVISANPQKLALPIDLSRVETLRKPFVDKLTAPALQIWPWVPWAPWNDCNPDIIFRVTQDCGAGQGQQVILEENFFNTRVNVDTTLNVNLMANDKACCLRTPLPCKESDCLVLTHACGVEADNIGGNVGADPNPATLGLVNPGQALALSGGADRPFAGAITISGTTECMEHVDYYEFEFARKSGSGWGAFAPVPAGSLGGFGRSFLDFTTTPFTWNSPGFAPTLIDSHTVYESLAHFQAAHPPSSGGWGSTRVWVTNAEVLAVWLTNAAAWADDTYQLQVKGYKEAGGHLTEVPLNICGEKTKSGLILTLDNRPDLPDPFHPVSTVDHPCGPGFVHLCSTQPDVDVIAVRLKHADHSVDHILPCHRYSRLEGDTMEIDFFANDPDGHLGSFTMDVTFAESAIHSLLGGSLSPLGGVPGIPAAAQAVSDYGAAVAAGATVPIWNGGAMTLSLNAAQVATIFKDPCCYQIDLWAYKRTIVDCDGNFPHRNLTEYSFFLG